MSTTQPIAPSEIAGAQFRDLDHAFDNVVSAVNKKLIASNGEGCDFIFHAETSDDFMSLVRDAFEKFGWESTIEFAYDEIVKNDIAKRKKLCVRPKKPLSNDEPSNTEELMDYLARHYPWARATVTRNDSGPNPEEKTQYVCRVDGSRYWGVDGKIGEDDESSEERLFTEVTIRANSWRNMVKHVLGALERCDSWVMSPVATQRTMTESYERGITDGWRFLEDSDFLTPFQEAKKAMKQLCLQHMASSISGFENTGYRELLKRMSCSQTGRWD